MRSLLLALCLVAAPSAKPPHPDLPGATWLGPAPPAHPLRIATIGPSLTELVLALGLGSNLVGVSRYDEAPEVAKLPRLGGIMDPSAETILALRPDVVLTQAAPNSDAIFRRLAELGLPVLELSLSSVADVVAAERAAGLALGVPERGRALADSLTAHIEDIARRTRDRPHPRVLIVYGWQPLVVAGPGSFADELLRAAGGVNAATAAKTAYATYSIEAAAAARPELIIDSAFDEAMPALYAHLPGLAGVRRVKPHTTALLHPGPQLAAGLDELVQALAGPAH